MLETQAGVPLPRQDTRPRQPHRKYAFDTMAVGEMFFVPNKDKNTLAQYASARGAKLGRKFSTRLVWMRQAHIRRKDVWLPSEEGAPGAVRGIGVWRVE